MDDTQDLHHQAQLDEQEQSVKRIDIDCLAYKALGVATAVRDFPSLINSELIINRLIELANEYDSMRARL